MLGEIGFKTGTENTNEDNGKDKTGSNTNAVTKKFGDVTSSDGNNGIELGHEVC